MKTILIAILAVLSVVLVGVSAYQRSNQPPEPMPIAINYSAVNQLVAKQPVAQNQGEIAGWRVYGNEQDRYEVQYPKEWTIKKAETGLVMFLAPKELDYGQVWISRDSSKKYKDINEFLGQWGYKDPNQASLWNVSAGEFVKINGISFYKYTWAHQSQGENYLTIIGGDLFSIEFRDDAATGSIENLRSYPQFVKMLSTLKFIK
ncbi:MAG: hypothetical protein V1819_00685 [bacterium]